MFDGSFCRECRLNACSDGLLAEDQAYVMFEQGELRADLNRGKRGKMVASLYNALVVGVRDYVKKPLSRGCTRPLVESIPP